jgi:hypothetical protein
LLYTCAASAHGRSADRLALRLNARAAAISHATVACLGAARQNGRITPRCAVPRPAPASPTRCARSSRSAYSQL